MPEPLECFAKDLDKALDDYPTNCAEAQLEHICNTVYKVAVDILEKRAKKNEDWFMAGIEEMEPAITVKRYRSLLEYKREPCEKTLAAYREAFRNAKRISHKGAESADANCLKLCSDIQISADWGNTRAMYEGMKKAIGLRRAIKTAPLQHTSSRWRDWLSTTRSCTPQSMSSLTQPLRTPCHYNHHR